MMYDVTNDQFTILRGRGGVVFFVENDDKVEMWLHSDSICFHTFYIRPVPTDDESDTEYLLWKEVNLKSAIRVLGVSHQNVSLRVTAE